MSRIFQSGLFFAFIGVLLAYVVSTAAIEYRFDRTVGYLFLVENAFSLHRLDDSLANIIWSIFAVLFFTGFAFGAHFSSEALTKQGMSAWQTIREMKSNNLLSKPGDGFILAKTTKPEKTGKYVSSNEFPNCLIIAPTGAGKGVGFVYPNLLTFEGSTVTLDIKGENYETTARWRASKGDKIYKFAPVQFGETSYRYNPLERIGKLTNYSQIQFELRKIGTLFLQADGAGEWLNGAIQMFTVAGMVAHERGDFTLGGIYKVLSEGEGNLQKHMANLSRNAKNPDLQRELGSLAKLETKTLSSYQSVMSNAGFDQWANPHIADMTSVSDFSFDDLRRERTSIYFVVSDGDIEPLASLVRLFFNELVTTIQAKKPGPDEPYKVMLILDEFHRLGKMSKVADAMTTIRGFNGRIAIITQTIPKLDAIYSYEERLSIQGGAGLKLYMTPSEEMTIEDLSKSCGMTTKRSISKSRRAGLGEKTTYSERTEEHPLLTEDEARRLPKDTSIIIVNGNQPVKVKAIVHYRDKLFSDILKSQENISWDIIDRNLQNVRIERAERRAERAEQIAQRATRKPEKQTPAPEKSDIGLLQKSRENLTSEDLNKMKELVEQAIGVVGKVEKLPEIPEKSKRVRAKKKVNSKVRISPEIVPAEGSQIKLAPKLFEAAGLNG